MATKPSPRISSLLQALLSIHHQQPRIIASPPIVPGTTSAAGGGGNPGPGASRRASVAIIIRLRPSSSTLSSPASSSLPSTAETSPLPSQIPLPSPPSSPPAVESTNLLQPQSTSLPQVRSIPTQLEEFFAQEWVQREDTIAEIMYIKRASRKTDKWSGHVAFPGGRMEGEDEDGRYTAMRETWEEVGLDLAEKEWLPVGQLDDREITTSLGKRLLMILSPFVFLHTSPHTPIPELQESEVASAHWIPIDLLHPPKAKYGAVGIDISTRLAPRSQFARRALRMLIGSMHFRCVLLPNNPCSIGQVQADLPVGSERPQLKLWGLTLGMTLDLLSSIELPHSSTPTRNRSDSTLSKYPHVELPTSVAPSMASIFPRFTYPDINVLIWIFGFRYRRLLAQSLRPPSPLPTSTTAEGDPTDPRVNWAGLSLGGSTLSAYYAAVRRALVVAVVLRAISALVGIGWAGWWLRGKMRERKLIKGI